VTDRLHVLFCCLPAHGHLYPILPLALARSAMPGTTSGRSRGGCLGGGGPGLTWRGWLDDRLMAMYR
jgi:hypothetical protein